MRGSLYASGIRGGVVRSTFYKTGDAASNIKFNISSLSLLGYNRQLGKMQVVVHCIVETYSLTKVMQMASRLEKGDNPQILL